MSDIENQFDDISDEYIALEQDDALSSYELNVNWPSLVRLMPEPPATVLDYGSGGGMYASKMRALNYKVVAADNSPKMVAAIRDVPAIVWTYGEPLDMEFDVVMCKLVIQFVDNLEKFARAMRDILNQEGKVIISVPHPDKTRALADEIGVHASQIGQSELSVRMIHREQSDYNNAFRAANFYLQSVDEPRDPADLDAQPKRLNMVFIKGNV